MRISSAIQDVAGHLPVGTTNPATREISVAIVSDHPLLRRSLRARLTRAPDLSVVASASSWLELLAHPRGRFDVVVLDIDADDGIPLRAKLAALETCAASIVPVSNDPSGPLANEALDAGSRPVVAKVGDAGLGAWLSDAWEQTGPVTTGSNSAEPSDGPRGVRVARDVRPRLSEQERRVLVLYVSGHKMAAVARRLNLKYDTAKSYLDRVRDKYERVGRTARTKLDLYQRAMQDGWLDDDGADGVGPTDTPDAHQEATAAASAPALIAISHRSAAIEP